MPDRLLPGQSLMPNQSLWSANGRFSFDYQDNGDLAIHKYFRDGERRCLRALTGGRGRQPGKCVMQQDGNLVVYSADGKVVWSSDTWRDQDGSELIMQDDGNVVIYRPSGGATWDSHTVAPLPAPGPPPTGHVMRPGEVLPAGQGIGSLNGVYRLQYQLDGKLVLYKTIAGQPLVYMWDSARVGRGDSLIMQWDGNLVSYGPDCEVLWSSDTWRDEDGSELVVQDDGNVVIYRPSGGATWASDTPRITLRQDLHRELHGHVEVTLRPSGEVRFSGLVRNHRTESITYQVRVVLRCVDPDGQLTAVALQRSGRVDGDLDPTWDPRNTWDETNQNPSVSAYYWKLERQPPQFDVYEDVHGGITGPVLDAVDWVAKFVIGGIIVTPTFGAIIFIGVELGSKIFGASWVSGARIISGALWLAGPWGTLYALAAEGVAAAGDEARELTSEEYNWLTEHIFGSTLPQREDILLTNTVGRNGRAFVFPRFDGKLTVNVGPARFDDPLFYKSVLCAHEMTHVWQVHNTPATAAWMIDALISQTLGGDDAYQPGKELKPWGEYNLEQQATIVQHWYQAWLFRHNQDLPPTSHDYDRYLDQNIQLGVV